MKWDDVKEAEVGEITDRLMLDRFFRTVYGAVAWPGQNPGYCVIVGMGYGKNFEGGDVYLLDEFESVDVRVLVRQIGALDFKYGPSKWVGDYRNNAAASFLRKLNAEYSDQAPRICLHFSPLPDMENPYAYLLPELKRLLDPDRRQLFLKNARVTEYLTNVKPDEMYEMRWGDYPAIEALALGVMALRTDLNRLHLPPETDKEKAYDPMTYGL